MAKSIIDKAEIGIRCPSCGYEIKKQIGWLRTHKDMACTACGSAISLETEQFKASIQRANKALDDFRRKLFKKR